MVFWGFCERDAASLSRVAAWGGGGLSFALVCNPPPSMPSSGHGAQHMTVCNSPHVQNFRCSRLPPIPALVQVPASFGVLAVLKKKFTYVYVFICDTLYVLHACRNLWRSEEGAGSTELELPMVLNCQVDAGNETAGMLSPLNC